jgi:hypothetical protein
MANVLQPVLVLAEHRGDASDGVDVVVGIGFVDLDDAGKGLDTEVGECHDALDNREIAAARLFPADELHGIAPNGPLAVYLGEITKG